MPNQFEQELLDGIGKRYKVDFPGLAIKSAFNELGLLHIIETNHPSKIVVTEQKVLFPDPNNPGKMAEMVTETHKRVLMNDEEREQYQAEIAMEEAARHLGMSVADLVKAVKQKAKKASPAVPVAKKKGKK